MWHFALLDPDPKHWSLHEKNHFSVAIISPFSKVKHLSTVLDSVPVKYLAASILSNAYGTLPVPVSHRSTLPMPDIGPLTIMN
jgi:hypothetical protein